MAQKTPAAMNIGARIRTEWFGISEAIFESLLAMIKPSSHIPTVSRTPLNISFHTSQHFDVKELSSIRTSININLNIGAKQLHSFNYN